MSRSCHKGKSHGTAQAALDTVNPKKDDKAVPPSNRLAVNLVTCCRGRAVHGHVGIVGVIVEVEPHGLHRLVCILTRQTRHVGHRHQRRSVLQREDHGGAGVDLGSGIRARGDSRSVLIAGNLTIQASAHERVDCIVLRVGVDVGNRDLVRRPSSHPDPQHDDRALGHLRVLSDGLAHHHRCQWPTSSCSRRPGPRI